MQKQPSVMKKASFNR